MMPTTAPSSLTESALSVSGMDCASCVAHVEKALRGVEGLESCQINLARGRAVVRFDPARTDEAKLADAVNRAGYHASVEHGNAGEVEERRVLERRQAAQTWFRRAIVGLGLWAPVELTHWLMALTGKHHEPMWFIWVALLTSTIAIVYVGAGFYRGAWNGFRNRTSNMDTLIAMGASVAYGYSLIAFVGFLAGWWAKLPHLYFVEGTALLGLISLGHWLEARARDKAGSAIRELMNLAPAMANRLEEGSGFGVQGSVQRHEGTEARRHEERGTSPLNPEPRTLNPESVPVSDVQVGDRLLVRPGDRVPVDGLVLEGQSEIDESMLSGEPLPVTRKAGDEIIGGTTNLSGALIFRATKVGSQTALAQIVRMVETAQSSKPPVQRLADRIAAVFVPTVLGIALLTGIAWFAWGTLHDWESSRIWGQIALSVCSVLIIACPCALGLAVPAALMVGVGRGAQRGILIRDIDALQNAGRIDTVVLDKTGTITIGKPRVAGVQAFNGIDAGRVLALAASAEQFSEHPLARAIVRHALDEKHSLDDPEEFGNHAGLGVVARINGQRVIVGNAALLAQHQVQPAGASPAAGETLVHVAAEQDNALVHVGTLALSDQIKADSVEAIRRLHSMGLRTVLLTGDNRASAEVIANQIGIDDIRADVRPGEKAQVVAQLQSTNYPLPTTNSRVAMVGDGINDAPALAQADLGIALGSGSDIAKETGDIVLVGSSLHGVAVSIRLSRATMSTIRQNLFFAFFYNVLAIPLAALGMLNPLIAAGAMALSDVTVLGNALLLKRRKID